MKKTPYFDDREYMLHASTPLEAAPLTPVEVARALTAIPSAPSIVAKLSLLLHQGNASLAEIGRLIRLDAGLSSRVLRLAYDEDDGRLQSCFTIEDAINRLGTERLHDLVTRVTRSHVFDLPSETYGMDMEDSWRWSVSTAFAAELLAQTTGQDADVAYCLGLLHNVGMFAVDAWVRQESPGIVFPNRGWPREYGPGECAILGFTHAEVGAALLSSWNFTRAMTEPIRHQHVPLRFGSFSHLTCLLHIAKWLGTAVCSEDGMPAMPDARFLDVLRLPSYELVKLVVEVRIRVGHARQTLRSLAA